METMWLVLTEIVAQTGDPPPKIGFMNITTWADSEEAASSKIKQYLESFGWHLVSVEEASVIDENADYGEDVGDMIERTRNNSRAIILGTFHTYRTN
jgi:hypothetical protein